MLGPVLHQELLLGGRRNRLHVFRWIYAGWLVLTVVGLFFQFMYEEANVAQARISSGGRVPEHHASAPEVVGARFAERFIWQQTLLLFLTVPLFADGALDVEKRQGS